LERVISVGPVLSGQIVITRLRAKEVVARATDDQVVSAPVIEEVVAGLAAKYPGLVARDEQPIVPPGEADRERVDVAGAVDLSVRRPWGWRLSWTRWTEMFVP
jgi:hypothetical protein